MSLINSVPASEQKQEWYNLWTPIIEACQKCDNADELILLQVLSYTEGTFTWKTLKHLTEFAINNAQNARDIFSRISSKIKTTASDHNEIIYELLAEVIAIPCLTVFGFTNLVYQRQDALDFIGFLEKNSKKIEITYIRGPSFKTQKINAKLTQHGSPPIYNLDSKKLINRLKSTYKEKEEQILKYGNSSNSFLLIVTNLFEAHQFWFEDQPYKGKHPIKAFVDSCEIPTIVLAPGLIPYISDKLENILLPFDRNKYIEMAYGIDSAVASEKHGEIHKKLEKLFWEAANKEK